MGKIHEKIVFAILFAIFISFLASCDSGTGFTPEKNVINLPEVPKKNAPTLYPVFDSKLRKYGFKDAQNKWVIKPAYTYASMYMDGFYLVRSEGTPKTEYLYLAKYGENIFGKKYDLGYDFESGTALVKDAGRYKVINRLGEVVNDVSMQDDKAVKSIYLSHNILQISNKGRIEDTSEKIKLLNVLTNKLIYEGTATFQGTRDNKFVWVSDFLTDTTTVIDYSGKVRHKLPGYQILKLGLEEMIIKKTAIKGRDDRLFVYDMNTKEINEWPEWKKEGDKEVLDRIIPIPEKNEKLYVYYTNTSFNIISIYNSKIDSKLENIRFGSSFGNFAEGVAPLSLFYKDEHYFYIDYYGEDVITNRINRLIKAYDFLDGYALVQIKNGKFCYIDKKGKITIREDIGYIDEDGEWILN